MTSPTNSGTSRALNPSSPPHERAPSPSEELVAGLHRLSHAIFLATDAPVAHDISTRVIKAADLIAAQQREIEGLKAERDEAKALADEIETGWDHARTKWAELVTETQAQLSAATARAEGAEDWNAQVIGLIEAGLENMLAMSNDRAEGSVSRQKSAIGYHTLQGLAEAINVLDRDRSLAPNKEGGHGK
jgi:cell division protein FtsB